MSSSSNFGLCDCGQALSTEIICGFCGLPTMREIKVWNMLDQPVITEADIYRPRYETSGEEASIPAKTQASRGANAQDGGDKREGS